MIACMLIADIGGNKARFAIAKKSTDIIWQKTIPTEGNFITELKNVLAEVPREFTIKHACFAAAGLVSDNGMTCELSNAPWHIRVQDIKKNTTIKNVTLINDFQAIGYAMNLMNFKKPENLQFLQGRLSGKPNRIAIIGAGTGLGHTFCVLDDIYTPFPAEGGSSLLTPTTKEEFALCEYLSKYAVPTEMENVVSGPGIMNVYKFLSRYSLRSKLKDAESILEQYHTDPVARKAFTMFQRFYGYAARNFCLYTLPDALLIAGGIAQKNKDLMGKPFMEGFLAISVPGKSKFLSSMPIAIIDDPNIGIKGAAWYAFYHSAKTKSLNT